jgi:hypothetical protein
MNSVLGTLNESHELGNMSGKETHIEVIRKNNSDYDPESLGGPDTMLSTYDPIYLGTALEHSIDELLYALVRDKLTRQAVRANA